MKRTILLSIMMMAVCIAKAQFCVDSIGNVENNGSFTNNGTFFVSTPLSSCININRTPNTNLRTNYNIQSRTNQVLFAGSGSWRTFNIYASTQALTTSNNGYCYGLYSEVLGSYNNKKCAIHGRINGKGIAIYGGTGSYFPSVTQTYAGYFEGNTHVQGDFSVSGNISGILLNSPANVSPNISSTNAMPFPERAALPNKLHNLTAHTFYIDAPQRTSHTEEAAQIPSTTLTEDEDVPEDDMVVGLPEPTAIERQIYAKQHYGFDADQLEEVFPDLVYENEDGTKSINYVEMVPILVQAINELKSEIDDLKGTGATKKAVTRGAGNVDGMDEKLTMLSLGQNKPNPFGSTTSIDVSVPDNVQKAFIYVYDLQGKKVDQVDITARGKQTIQLNAATLSDGMFLYSLIADGKVVETRRMIVEKIRRIGL